MLADIERAKIVITNYHAFKLRERIDLSKGGRSLLQGRGDALNTVETEGQMLQRVMPGLMGMKNILVINDEAHHCYREKPGEELEGDLKGDDKKTYVVQTNERIIERCVLMATDPGDLILDPTCGSGTTGYVAEKWGRRDLPLKKVAKFARRFPTKLTQGKSRYEA